MYQCEKKDMLSKRAVGDFEITYFYCTLHTPPVAFFWRVVCQSHETRAEIKHMMLNPRQVGPRTKVILCVLISIGSMGLVHVSTLGEFVWYTWNPKQAEFFLGCFHWMILQTFPWEMVKNIANIHQF